MKILVVGLGVIGSELASFDDFDGIHHTELGSVDLADYDMVINCAAIAGASKCKDAGYDAVMEANVDFPRRLYSVCKGHGKPMVHLSTSGIYFDQVAGGDERYWEGSPIQPHNLYCASKIVSESVLMSRASRHAPVFIFRLPWFVHPQRFKDRLKTWSYVQGTYTSIVTGETLSQACIKIARTKPFWASGIYNVATETVWFPDFFIKMTGETRPVRVDYEEDMTSAVPLDTRRFEETFYGTSKANSPKPETQT